MLGNEVVGSKQETTGAAGGVADGGSCLRSHDFNDSLDERPWGEVWTGAAFNVFCVFLQETFVDIALNVYVQANPGFSIDELNKAFEFGGVLDSALRFAEDNAERVRLFAQGFEN